MWCISTNPGINLVSAPRQQPSRLLRAGRTAESNRNHRGQRRRSEGDEDAAQGSARGQVGQSPVLRRTVVLGVEVGLDAQGLEAGRMVQEEEEIVINEGV